MDGAGGRVGVAAASLGDGGRMGELRDGQQEEGGRGARAGGWHGKMIKTGQGQKEESGRHEPCRGSQRHRPSARTGV